MRTLVVGASRGIGHAVARKLLQDGHTVTGWSRGRPADLTIAWQPVDVRRHGEVVRALSALTAPVDSIVYAAGVAHWGAVGEQDVAEWTEVFATNVTGAFSVLDAYVRIFDRHPSRVVVIASEASLFARAGRSGYHASKAALATLAESYRAEARGSGTQVTVLYPGRTNTTFSERPEDVNALALQPTDLAGVISYVLGLPRHIEVRSIELAAISLPYKGMS